MSLVRTGSKVIESQDGKVQTLRTSRDTTQHNSAFGQKEEQGAKLMKLINQREEPSRDGVKSQNIDVWVLNIPMLGGGAGITFQVLTPKSTFLRLSQ